MNDAETMYNLPKKVIFVKNVLFQTKDHHHILSLNTQREKNANI